MTIEQAKQLGPVAHTSAGWVLGGAREGVEIYRGIPLRRELRRGTAIFAARGRAGLGRRAGLPKERAYCHAIRGQHFRFRGIGAPFQRGTSGGLWRGGGASRGKTAWC